MRVVFCRSNPIAPDPRVEKEAKALVDAGYEVQAIGWDRSASLPLVEEISGVQVQRLHIRARFGHGLGNLPSLLRWQLGLAVWFFRNHKMYDVIHACDFDTVLPAIIMKMLFGKTLVYDIFDFYSAHLRRTPEWIKRLIRAVDYWAISRADAVIIVDDARREQIRGSKPGHLEVIYNSPDDVRSSLKQDDFVFPSGADLRIAYVGLLQVERGLFEILQVMERHRNWSLVIAGFGGDETEIAARSSMLENVRFLGRVSYDVALRLSFVADVLFATYDPNIPNHRFSSPNKVFESMMLAKPIIVAEHTNMDKMVEKYQCGIIAPYGNVNALEMALTQLEKDPEMRQQLGENGRVAYNTEYGWHIMRSRLLGLYRKILRRE